MKVYLQKLERGLIIQLKDMGTINPLDINKRFFDGDSQVFFTHNLKNSNQSLEMIINNRVFRKGSPPFDGSNVYNITITRVINSCIPAPGTKQHDNILPITFSNNDHRDNVYDLLVGFFKTYNNE